MPAYLQVEADDAGGTRLLSLGKHLATGHKLDPKPGVENGQSEMGPRQAVK